MAIVNLTIIDGHHVEAQSGEKRKEFQQLPHHGLSEKMHVKVL